ncbi:MAG: TSUP family transporter [Armatimonadota bacterium]
MGIEGIEWVQTLYTSLVILVASAVHGVAGFGISQVTMGIVPLFRSPQSASVIFSIVAVVANFRVWWSVRDDFQWRDWATPVIGLIAGLPIGIYFFKQWDEQTLRTAIGITLFLSVIVIASMQQVDAVEKWLETTRVNPGWPTAVIAGFLSGALGGAVAIPGPPMILYGTFMLAAGLWKSSRMKATFTAFFGTLMLYRVASVVYTGDASVALGIEAAIAIPALLIGAWAGILVYEKVPENIFNWIVLALLTVNAVILVFTSGGG